MGPKTNSPSPAQRGVPAGARKQIPMCSLRSLTCLQVQVLPRQWMVGPSSHSRPWLGETPTGASSAVNGRASRWRELPARTGQPLWQRCRPQHEVKTAAPKLFPPLKPVRGVSRNRRTRIGRVLRQTKPGTAPEGRRMTRLASSRTGENPPCGMNRGGGGTVGTICWPFATMLERADTAEAIGLNQRASALLDQ